MNHVDQSFILSNVHMIIDDRDTSTTLFIQLYHKQIGSNKLFKYDGIGLVSNKCSIVLNSNSKYLVTRKHDKVVIGKL